MDTSIVKQQVNKTRGKFTKALNIILVNTNLSDGAFRTYILLLSYKIAGGNVFPSITTLAKSRAKSRKTISSHIKELREKGFITTKKRGFSRTNLYFFPMEENYANEAPPSVKIVTPEVKIITPPKEPLLPPNKTENKKTDFNNFGNLQETGKELLRQRADSLRHKP